jgi:hypothetical protein
VSIPRPNRPDPSDLAEQAFVLHEQGETYRAIGAALGISCGKAHHLVGTERVRRAAPAEEPQRNEKKARSKCLSATERRAGRNDRIVMARLSGMPEAAVASTFDLSIRQIRRILADHRRRRGLVAPVAVKAMEDAHSRFNEALSEADDARAVAEDPEFRMQLLERRTAAIRELSESLGLAGAVSPFRFAFGPRTQAADKVDRQDRARRINEGIRRVLARVDVSDDVTERVVDEVMKGLDLEECLARSPSAFMREHVLSWTIARAIAQPECAPDCGYLSRSSGAVHHLRNRRSQVRILSGALETRW